MDLTKQIERIYGHLQDEESRIVFQHRLMYFLDRKNMKHIWNMCIDVNKFEQRRFPKKESALSHIDRIKDANTEVIFCGVGGHKYADALILRFLKYYGLNISLYCDMAPSRVGKIDDGLETIFLDDLKTKHESADIIVEKQDVSLFRKKYGLNVNKVIPLSFNLQEYFGMGKFLPEENEIYLDVGVHDGRTIGDFVAWAKKGYKKIYAFEPEQQNFIRSKAYIENLKIENVELSDRGAWSENTILRFQEQGSGSHVSNTGIIKIPVTTIDSVVKDEKVTFIKMDIEGSELEAIKGARKCIARHSPKLAISVYHKPEDILTLPEIILDINPRYNFYLRHHRMAREYETVLYALAENT